MSDLTNHDQYEEKFFVLNRKRIEELNEVADNLDEHPANANLNKAINDWVDAYKNDTDTPEKLDQKYLVVNHDEPYAEQVFKIIIEAEE